jgi:hypothetical protein
MRGKGIFQLCHQRITSTCDSTTMLPFDSFSADNAIHRSPLTCIERTRSLTAFALSSPVFTKEEEEAEWNSLSQADRHRIFQDLHGFSSDQHQSDGIDDSTSSTGNESECTCATNEDDSEERVNNFIAANISFPAKEAYLKVRERNPALVKTESNIRDFLRCENNNVERAAQRLVSYWAVRREVFGYSRYLLPLTLEGAMAADIDNLARGFAYISASLDFSERPVVFFDRIRSAKSIIDRDTICRCLFYALNTAAAIANSKYSEYCSSQKSNKLCRSLGVVLLGNYRVSSRSECFAFQACFLTFVCHQAYELSEHFDRVLMKTIAKIGRSLPARLVAWHFCCGSEKSV